MGNDKNNNDNKFLDKDVIITLTGAADSSWGIRRTMPYRRS